MDALLEQISAEQPVLIAGPTASGKSALALAIAAYQGGKIINADALQVFDNWRILTARPSRDEEAAAPHCLYGHVAGDQAYSVGDWLRDLREVMKTGPRPIIVGGTGLYFSALTEGLVEIPATPDHIRKEAMNLITKGKLQDMLDQLDAATLARIDQRNPMRVQRAWEVLASTGQGLADWQDQTPPPDMPAETCFPIVLGASKDWLTPRINRRFDSMISLGALEEARANLPTWSLTAPSSKAIGAPELIAHLQGSLSLEDAIDAAKIATRQYAKRQRTWFKARMKNWTFHPLG